MRKKIIKILIGDLPAVYKNGKWSCSEPAIRETLETFTRCERENPRVYMPDKEFSPAVIAAMDLGAQILEQPDGDDYFVEGRIY